MCGIAGWLSSEPVDEACGWRMAADLRHRGPDAAGVRTWPSAALVHTRLSIIDLSPGGTQPMPNEDGSVWVAFNGEIYNHKELRTRLEAQGHKFRGFSDTEVIPHLYEEEGPGFIGRLRGMFAFALYDASRRLVLLGRDRFGIKPLFYASSRAGVAFASEIRALRRFPGIDDRPDQQAISDFAALLFVPAPLTIFRGIRALEPGELLAFRLEGGQIERTSRRYHRWRLQPRPELELASAADQAQRLVAQAVERQLESDVPLGALLSGGIDSSLVSAAAQRSLRGSLETFNVRFSDRSYDETWAALDVAKSIGSRHETLEMDSARGSWEHVAGLLEHCGQPFADTSLFGVQAISREMRRHVTVALSGDGGDEGFGGYNVYRWIARLARWGFAPPPVWRVGSAVSLILARLGLVREHMPRQIAELAGTDDIGAMEKAFSWVSPAEHATLVRNVAAFPVRRLFEPQWEHRLPRRVSRLERLSALTTETNFRLILANDYLFKVDIASMKESLEVRVPMLDEDLVDFGLTLPHELKEKNRVCKRVLREVARRELPPAVAQKPKVGFGVPVDTWADPSLKTGVADTLLSGSTPLKDWFDAETYQPWVDAFCSGRPFFGLSRQDLYQRATMLLALHLSLQARPADNGGLEPQRTGATANPS